MSAALDEQNVPEDGRWLIISPYERQLLMQTDIAQAYFTGDASSIVRTGKIGMLDRFEVYVSNLLPRGEAGKALVAGLSATSTGATLTQRNCASYDGCRYEARLCVRIADQQN